MINKYYTYALFNHTKKVFIGFQNYKIDIYEIVNELHETIEDLIFTKIEKTSKASGFNTTLKKLNDQLTIYKYGHKGKCPKYNKEAYLITLMNNKVKYEKIPKEHPNER